MRGEVINIHLGQAGTQIGHACWELNCLEHGLSLDGKLRYEDSQQSDSSFHTFYSETDKGKHVPRAVFIDTEPTCIDEIRTGHYQRLFNPDTLITGKEDAANNFARGFNWASDQLLEPSMEAIRRQLELCDRCQGFVVYHSLGGGTGSGLASRLINVMSTDLAKLTKIELVAYPSPKLQSAMVEPYNAVLGTHASIEDSQVVFLLDNEAAWNVCRRKLGVERPTFTNINRILAQIISSLTSPLRFSGALNGDLTEFQTNLVPYPRIHFPLITYAPLLPECRAIHETNSVDSLTNAVFQPSNSLLSVDISKGKYMSVVLLYRGDINGNQVNRSVNRIKSNGTSSHGASKHVRFVNWCPTGFKIDINNQPCTTVPGGDLAQVTRSCTMLANTTSIGDAIVRNNNKVDAMFQKRAFLHWYLAEGLDESEFARSIDNLHALEKDYLDAGTDTPNQ